MPRKRHQTVRLLRGAVIQPAETGEEQPQGRTREAIAPELGDVLVKLPRRAKVRVAIADVPRTIAAMVRAVYPAFKAEAFVRSALDGYDALELMQRGQKIAQTLHQYLPADYDRATAILLDSLDQAHDRDMGQSLGSFLYLPHTQFVATYGLGHFEVSMRALHALTQRFTAEFSIPLPKDEETKLTYKVRMRL